MISDLKHDSSSIISLKKDDVTGKLIANLHSENTFGWATEDIIYNIFQVPTTRNYYLSNEVGQILHLISEKNSDPKEITQRLEKIKQIQMKLKDVDPLKQVINKLIERFDK